MEVLKPETKGLCPKCLSEISAKIIEDKGKVYIFKNCIKHGKFYTLVESDPEFYKKTMNLTFKTNKRFNKVDLPVTFSCNLKCNICYAPKRNIEDMPLESLKDKIKNFRGTYISLAGGEPTMRKDLFDIIRFTIKNRKIPVLVTNGLKLVDMEYVKKLEESGLRLVNFSFNGFSNKTYERINGKKLLGMKLKALSNLKNTKILTGLSMMVEKGLNESDVKKVLDYCLANNPQFYELRIKSANIVGRHTDSKVYSVSELLEILCNAIGHNKKVLYKKINDNVAHSPCRFGMEIYFHKRDESTSLIFARVNRKKKDQLPVRVAKISFALDLARRLRIDKVYLWVNLIRNVPLKESIKILTRTIQGWHLAMLKVEIRSWPNKHTIDLMEISHCPVLRINEAGEALPFCYSLAIAEERKVVR